MQTRIFYFFALIIFYTTISCNTVNEEHNTSQINDSSATITAGQNEHDQAKAWFTKIVEDDSYSDKKNYTKDYAEYKQDAINLVYDGDLTDEQFAAKWKDKFDIKYVSKGTGFMISAQDNGKLVVEKCDLKPSTDNSFIFDVLIKDTDFSATFKREIKIIKEADSFVIADIKEFEN